MADMRSQRPRRGRAIGRGRIGLLALGVALFATACGGNHPLDTLNPEGPAARSIDNLLNVVLAVAGVVFVFVNVGVLVCAIKFRQRKGEEDVFPVQVHGNHKLELGWTIAPAVLLAGIAGPTTVTLLDIYESKADEAEITVLVEGQQWWWSYRYDVDGNGSFNDPADVVTATDLVIPVGKTIALKVTSNDVIHSFWIPRLNGKKDAVPGRIHDWWIEADKPGYYLGQCTEFCGLSHAYMRMGVRSLPEDEFNQWLTDQAKPAVLPVDNPSAMAGAAVFAQQCASCHEVSGLNSTGCEAAPPGEELDPEEFDPATECYPGIAEGWTQAAQVSGNAPNLTHLMSRERFIGGVHELYDENGEPDRNTLEAWIRDPQEFKALAPTPSRGNEFGRGMPQLPLTEEQLDNVVDYLLTLK